MRRDSVTGLISFPTLLLLLLSSPALAQQDPDPLEIHARLYEKVAPAVVFVRGGARSGSGFFLHECGIVVTTSTAVTSQGATVQTPDHRKFSATLLARVPELELAVLKIPGAGYPALELGDSDAAKIGQVAYALGDSFQSLQTDDQVAISVGILSARYELRSRQNRGGYVGPVLETNAAINQNGAGGPLLDGHGRVIGMITLNYEESRFAGVAIPVNRLKTELQKVLRRTVEGDRTVESKPATPGWFGVGLRETEEGLEITRVNARGPAAQAGIRRGDRLTHVQGRRVRKSESFREMEVGSAPGSTVAVTVERDGNALELKLTVAERKMY